MNIPRIVLAGTHSGVGKTTLTLGLLAALRQRGLKVQPFKVGPDYIDPGLHGVAAGRNSHNLDSWLGTAQSVQELFMKRAAGCDVALVEGVMGLYDGAKGQGEVGSTAQVAKILQAPVVLVFSAKGLARSAAALVKGYQSFDPAVQICGVIANGVGSDRHRAFLEESLREELGIPLLGAVSHRQDIVLPQRHLGLLPATEHSTLHNVLMKAGEHLEQQVDIDQMLALAKAAAELQGPSTAGGQVEHLPVRLAVARDEAFHFYYEDSLDYLRELGAELVFFSPLRDRCLPSHIDGIYIGGGFPEQFLPALSGNHALPQAIRQCWAQGMPVYAECGGLMYLCREISNLAGESYPGVGLVPARVKMANRLAALGYVRARALQPSILGPAGQELKGHEFHWSTVEPLAEHPYAYSLTGGRGAQGRSEGYMRGNLLASYVHLHFRYQPQAARHFLAACLDYKESLNHEG